MNRLTITAHLAEYWRAGTKEFGLSAGWAALVSFVLGGVVLWTGCSGASDKPSPSNDSSPPPTSSGAWIMATPNPVPAGAKLGTTTITWDTGDGTPGVVHVSQGGDPEKRFSGALASGSKEADWIGKRPCEFRLYSGTEKKTMLASVTVTRAASDDK